MSEGRQGMCDWSPVWGEGHENEGGKGEKGVG